MNCSFLILHITFYYDFRCVYQLSILLSAHEQNKNRTNTEYARYKHSRKFAVCNEQVPEAILEIYYSREIVAN